MMSVLRKPSARFLTDEHGAMTVEFMLWLPLILGWFVISATAYSAFSARADAGNAAFAMADVMSRQVTVDETFVDDMAELHKNLLPGTSERAFRVSSVIWSETADRPFVIWSSARGMPKLTNGSATALELPQMGDGEAVVLVETAVPYRFLSDWIGSGTTVWRHVLPVRSRYVAAVTNTDAAPSASVLAVSTY